MRSLLGALLASSLAFGPAILLAADGNLNAPSKMRPEDAEATTKAATEAEEPPAKLTPAEQAFAARKAAKEKWDKMTPEEKAAARRAAWAKRSTELTPLDQQALDEAKAARQKALDDLTKPLVGDFPSPRDYMKYRWPTPQEKAK